MRRGMGEGWGSADPSRRWALAIYALMLPALLLWVGVWLGGCQQKPTRPPMGRAMNVTQIVHPIVFHYSCQKNPTTGAYELTCLDCAAPYPICNSPGDAQQFSMACDNCCGGLVAAPAQASRPPMGRENPEAVAAARAAAEAARAAYSEASAAVNPNKIFTCEDGTEHTFTNNTPARMICPPNLTEGGSPSTTTRGVRQGPAGLPTSGPDRDH
jgi:hypothetical protein